MTWTACMCGGSWLDIDQLFVTWRYFISGRPFGTRVRRLLSRWSSLRFGTYDRLPFSIMRMLLWPKPNLRKYLEWNNVFFPQLIVHFKGVLKIWYNYKKICVWYKIFLQCLNFVFVIYNLYLVWIKDYFNAHVLQSQGGAVASERPHRQSKKHYKQWVLSMNKVQNLVTHLYRCL